MASSFVGVVKSRPSSFKKKVGLEARIFELIVNSIRDPSLAGEAFNGLIQELKLSLPRINNEVATNIIANIMVELFADSNPINERPGSKPLGDLATDMLIYFTSFDGE